MDFVMPKDPRLFPRMLNPWSSKRQLDSNGGTIYFVPWGRNAIYLGIRALGLAPGDNILVPSFHCAAVVEPILSYGAKIKFYNIDKNGLPDVGDIESKIDARSKALLAIHYFGYPQPIGSLQRLCANHRLYLIEDCAHVLVGETEGKALGSFGDFSIFSWRKFLPLCDGGLLVLNNQDIRRDFDLNRGRLLFQIRATKNTIDKLIEDSNSDLGRMAGKLSDRLVSIARWFTPRETCSADISGTNGSESSGTDFNTSSIDAAMSNISKYILRRSDVSAVLESRRFNYRYLHNALIGLPEVTPFFASLPENVCPWVFPMLVPKYSDFQLLLRKKGIPAVTWGGVIHHDLPLAQFPDADFLYRHLVFLPVHQDLHESEMQIMIEVIKASLLVAGSQ